MMMEEKNMLVKNYILEIANNLNKDIPNFINEEKINRAIEMYSNSEKDFEIIKNEITELVNKMIKEYNNKREMVSEKHYELNDFFDCRISNNTLHIHIVPPALDSYIAKMGLREFYKFVDKKLEDVLPKISSILQSPDNLNVRTVFAVSKLLRTRESQEMFRKYGFDASMSNNEKFIEMFNEKRIGQASISRDKFLALYMSSEQQMLDNINHALNSDFMIDMLKQEWEKGHNISSLGNLIGEAYNHMIINKDGFEFETYMKTMEGLYFKLHSHQISPDEFNTEKAKTISYIIAQKLQIDTTKEVSIHDQEKIKNYFLKEYVVNGYVSHSFPDVYKHSILEQGLIANPIDRGTSSNEIQEIQELFMSKGIAGPLGGYPYYGGSGIYYEHDFTKVFQHAINSPEWFNFFTSSDHSKGFQSLEQSPYILRDENACRRNIMDLCSNAELTLEETEKVVKFYSETYKKFSSPTLNVGLISKQVVGKSDIEKTVPRDLGLIDTIVYTMNDNAKQYIEHTGNVSHETILPENIKVTNIPTANKLMYVTGYSRETKEHLTDLDLNLAMIQRAEQVKSRMITRMIEKTEETKKILLQKKNEQRINESTNIENQVTKTDSAKNESQEIKQEQPKSVTTQSVNETKKGFDQRSQSEVQIANQIKEKNMSIKQQKEQQRSMEKPKVKTLIKPTNTGGNSQSGGFADTLILTLITGFVAGAIFMVVYSLLK